MLSGEVTNSNFIVWFDTTRGRTHDLLHSRRELTITPLMRFYKYQCLYYVVLIFQPKDHLEVEDLVVAKEALEVLTICLCLCPPALEALNKDKSWQIFIKDLLLLCKHRLVTIFITKMKDSV